MRVTADDQDLAQRVRELRLDGETLEWVTAADDVEGWVEVLVMDERGHPVIDGDEIKRERRTGRVEIVMDVGDAALAR